MDFPKSVPGVGLVDGQFVDEDQVQGTPGSLIPAAWGNSVTLELLSIIKAAGLEPDEDQKSQVLEAISTLIASNSTDTLNTSRIDIASATWVNLAELAPNTRHINITGTATINGFTVAAGRCYFVRFAAAQLLTNSASLTTNSGTNVLTAAGDTCIIRATADNVVEILSYTRSAADAGEVGFFARNTPPPGWLKANGAALSRTTYAGLFAAIGTTFGAGDGVSTFNLPDLRGEFPRGWDDGRSADPGRGFGTSQSGAIEAHQHLAGTALLSSYVKDYGAISTTGTTGYIYANSTTNTDRPYTSTTGGTETRPRNVALLACIKY